MSRTMGFTVLIVDDEPKICLTLRDILRKHGFYALFCTDPLQVIPTLRATPADLLLTDVKMPGKNGIDLLRSVRAEKGSIPVIMISGQATIESVVVAMKYGGHDRHSRWHLPARICSISLLGGDKVPSGHRLANDGTRASRPPPPWTIGPVPIRLRRPRPLHPDTAAAPR